MPKEVAMNKKGRKTPAIMFQGTSSNAGKSVLAAGFCRLLLQDGYRPAPFKAQNMSLNSFVTPDGREIGRAQATQAQACRLEPDARMNPVLLKPSSDVGSQVLLMGRPVGSMRVREYVAYKPQAFARAKEAYDSLAGEYDVMVLEGAGSPAEINLKAHDIVNMTMAAHAEARVLLVGDIDRGGVFASLVGTMSLLEPWERDLVSGFVLNRFRGDATLLDPALEAVSGMTGKPFHGTIPYLQHLGLPEEDSVSFKERGPGIHGRAENLPKLGGALLDVAVMDLPHISNFTDFDALAAEPDVRLRVIREARDLETSPDVLLLPGSKNTIQDMLALRAQGLEEAARALALGGKCVVVGICGGLQMLGERILDPLGLESGERSVRGLGLLPLETELVREKTLARVEALHVPSGLRLKGYEIHHGATRLPDGGEARQLRPAVRRVHDNADIGWLAPRDASDASLVWGSYLHGIFDDDRFRRWFLDSVRERKGLLPAGRVLAPFDLEPALERLAENLREHLDWRGIYKLLGLPA